MSLSTSNARQECLRAHYLGPLLFLIFINDITEVIYHAQILLYADDVKIFRLMENAQHALELQSDLDSMVQWSVENQLPCLLYTSPSPRDRTRSRMPSSA